MARCRELFPSARLSAQLAAEAEGFASRRLAWGLAAAVRAGMAGAATVSSEAAGGDAGGEASSTQRVRVLPTAADATRRLQRTLKQIAVRVNLGLAARRTAAPTLD